MHEVRALAGLDGAALVARGAVRRQEADVAADVAATDAATAALNLMLMCLPQFQPLRAFPGSVIQVIYST